MTKKFQVAALAIASFAGLIALAGAWCGWEFWVSLHPPQWWMDEGLSPEDFNKPRDVLLPVWLVSGLPALICCALFWQRIRRQRRSVTVRPVAKPRRVSTFRARTGL